MVSKVTSNKRVYLVNVTAHLVGLPKVPLLNMLLITEVKLGKFIKTCGSCSFFKAQMLS